MISSMISAPEFCGSNHPFASIKEQDLSGKQEYGELVIRLSSLLARVNSAFTCFATAVCVRPIVTIAPGADTRFASARRIG